MLLSIETKRRGPVEEDAVGLLVACHARIRSFTATALRLSQAVGAEPSEVADVAGAVHRYFTVALPLHVEDEDRVARRSDEARLPDRACRRRR